jgi:hypothetical protein
VAQGLDGDVNPSSISFGVVEHVNNEATSKQTADKMSDSPRW